MRLFCFWRFLLTFSSRLRRSIKTWWKENRLKLKCSLCKTLVEEINKRNMENYCQARSFRNFLIFYYGKMRRKDFRFVLLFNPYCKRLLSGIELVVLNHAKHFKKFPFICTVKQNKTFVPSNKTNLTDALPGFQHKRLALKYKSEESRILALN